MSLSAILFILVFVVGSVMAIGKHPFWGLLLYVHVYFNTPQHHFWANEVPDWHWAFMAAMVLVASTVLHKDKLSPVKLAINWPFRFLVLLLLYMLLLAPFTPFSDNSLGKVYDYFRYVVIFALTVKIISTHKQFRIFAAVWLVESLLLSRLAFHYFGGSRLEYGLADAGSANLAAAFMVMSMPLCLSFWIGQTKKEKLFSVGVAPFLLNVFMMYRSRGAFMGLLAAGFALIPSLGVFKGQRKKIFLAALGGLIAVFVFIDPQFVQRLGEINTQDLNKASTGRIETWTHGLDMVKDYPLGAGGEGFTLLSPRYLPVELLESRTGDRASHNTYLQALVEQGIPGFVLYMGFIISTLWGLRKQRKRLLKDSMVKGHQALQNPKLFMDNLALQSSLVGILGAAFFMERFFFLGIYWFAALAVVVANLDKVES